jgi:hypothetical protein
MSQVQYQKTILNQSLDAYIDEVVFTYQKKQNKENSKVSRVENLINFFKNKLFSIKEAKEVPVVLDEQQKQAQAFMDSKMYESYATMINYGYKPTVAQKKSFDTYVQKLLERSDDDSRKELNSYIALGHTLNHEQIYNYLLKVNYGTHLEVVRKAMIDEKDDPNPLLFGYIRELPHFLSEFKRVLNEPDFSVKFLKHCIKAMRNNQYDYEIQYQQESLLNLYKFDADLFLKNISLPEMMSFIKFNHDIYQEISGFTRNKIEQWLSKDMPQLIESYYKDDITRQLRKTKEMFHGDLENMALKQAHESIEHHATRQLPEAIKNKISNIESIYWELKNTQANTQVMDAQTDFDMKNIFEKRIPEVLEKYLLVPDDYRNTMKHEITGKTAYEMMAESLDNYEQRLKTILDERVQNQLSDMNATKIYSKKIM